MLFDKLLKGTFDSIYFFKVLLYAQTNVCLRILMFQIHFCLKKAYD